MIRSHHLSGFFAYSTPYKYPNCFIMSKVFHSYPSQSLVSLYSGHTNQQGQHLCFKCRFWHYVTLCLCHQSSISLCPIHPPSPFSFPVGDKPMDHSQPSPTEWDWINDKSFKYHFLFYDPLVSSLDQRSNCFHTERFSLVLLQLNWDSSTLRPNPGISQKCHSKKTVSVVKNRSAVAQHPSSVSIL